MTVYSLDLADKQELAFLAKLMADVRTAAPDGRFLLVGAMARDLLLYHAHGIRAARATPDPGRIEERLQSILTPEIDAGGPLRLIGEVVDMDMNAERALKLLVAFFAGLNGEQRP